ISVVEPDTPHNFNNSTTYTYNATNQLTKVTMLTVSGTQIRTFTWNGTDLASATNPENGTVTYTYDRTHHVTSRTDAKGQKTWYNYDAYGRLTNVYHCPSGCATGVDQYADATQQVDYYYDADTQGFGYSS